MSFVEYTTKVIDLNDLVRTLVGKLESDIDHRSFH